MPVRAAGSGPELAQGTGGAKKVVFFWASWFEPSKEGGALHGSFLALADKYPQLDFVLIEAEKVPEVSEQFGVAVVPTFVTLSGKEQVEKLEGVNPAELARLVKRLSELAAPEPTVFAAPATAAAAGGGDSAEALNRRLERIINTAPVMLFMKGTPAAPRCGFSRQIVELLQTNQIPFSSFDILSDEEVRQGLKTYSDWPTYPQLYSAGSLVGGLDIVKEMVQEGDLAGQLGLSSSS